MPAKQKTRSYTRYNRFSQQSSLFALKAYDIAKLLSGQKTTPKINFSYDFLFVKFKVRTISSENKLCLLSYAVKKLSSNKNF